jgi:RNA polymerase sigma-70 factor (ECF subfamily)
VIGPRNSAAGASNAAQDSAQGIELSDLVDPELVEKAVAGCPAAFAALVGAHYDAVYRMAWRWLGAREEAEDAAQDVCIRLATAIRSFRCEAGFSTWLYRLTYSVAMDRLRARRRAQRHADPGVVVLFRDRVQASPEAEALGNGLWDEVRRLPAQQRDAVLLVYGEDLSHADAAGVMGCSEKTVSWHLHAARKRLKERLKAAV